MEVSVRQMIADYLRNVAVWRRQRAQDDLHDARNLRSASALESLADYVSALPDDDERIQDLTGSRSRARLSSQDSRPPTK